VVKAHNNVEPSLWGPNETSSSVGVIDSTSGGCAYSTYHYIIKQYIRRKLSVLPDLGEPLCM